MSSCNCNQNDYLPPCDNGCANPKPPCPPPYLPPICPPENPCPPRPGCGNNTPWYGLPQWKASDVTSWLMQMNGAMLRIDTILHDLALRTGINGLPDDLVTTVSKLCGDVEQMKCTMGELTNKQANVELLMQNINTQFSAMKTDVASLQLTMTNFDTRLMATDSKANALKNDVTLIKTDINMLSSTVQNLQSNFTQFQMTVNTKLAEFEASITELEENNTRTTSNRYKAISAGDSGGRNNIKMSHFVIGNYTSANYKSRWSLLDSNDMNRGCNIFFDILQNGITLLYYRSPKWIVLTKNTNQEGDRGFSIEHNLTSSIPGLPVDVIYNIPSGFHRTIMGIYDGDSLELQTLVPGGLHVHATADSVYMKIFVDSIPQTTFDSLPTKIRLAQISAEYHSGYNVENV